MFKGLAACRTFRTHRPNWSNISRFCLRGPSRTGLSSAFCSFIHVGTRLKTRSDRLLALKIRRAGQHLPDVTSRTLPRGTESWARAHRSPSRRNALVNVVRRSGISGRSRAAVGCPLRVDCPPQVSGYLPCPTCRLMTKEPVGRPPDHVRLNRDRGGKSCNGA